MQENPSNNFPFRNSKKKSSLNEFSFVKIVSAFKYKWMRWINEPNICAIQWTWTICKKNQLLVKKPIQKKIWMIFVCMKFKCDWISCQFSALQFLYCAFFCKMRKFHLIKCSITECLWDTKNKTFIHLLVH